MGSLRRGIDIAGGLTGAALSLVPGLIIAAAVRVFMGGPVIFRQERDGLHGRPFSIYKFRSMKNSFDEKGAFLPDAERLTGLGLFLRRWKLDELPQFINVIKGDMSLVGPRPLTRADMEALVNAGLNEELRQRESVLPGLTGRSQIAPHFYPNDEPAFHRDRLQHDLAYIAQRRTDPWLDAEIMLKTVFAIATGRAIDRVAAQVKYELAARPPPEPLP